MTIFSIRWDGDMDGQLWLLDQTRLPLEICEFCCVDVATVWEAIRSLRVRGAPAIGIAAAYGMVLAAQRASTESMREACRQAMEYLSASRPTAVNLFWALRRMETCLEGCFSGGRMPDRDEVLRALFREAHAIHDEDRQLCRAIGRHGAGLIHDGANILTHCNTGGLATSEYGTALSCIFTAHDEGKMVHVYVDETRPLLQGARLTTWELQQHGVSATLICDSVAAHLMQKGRVDLVITGADRIAANGDTANKVGTYGLAVLARAHEIPFYVAAPYSTFDSNLATGLEIPIEERSADEVTRGFGRPTAPDGTAVYNPAFDVTPAHLISGIITDRGIEVPPLDGR